LPIRSPKMIAPSRGESEYSRQVALPSTITGDPLVVRIRPMPEVGMLRTNRAALMQGHGDRK
jgi:hypothetical protein